jgi:hypothetical protein
MLFHLKAREPLDVTWHVYRRIHAALSAVSRVTSPILGNLHTSIVFLFHTAIKCPLAGMAEHARYGLFGFPAGCRNVNGGHASCSGTHNVGAGHDQTKHTPREKPSFGVP